MMSNDIENKHHITSLMRTADPHVPIGVILRDAFLVFTVRAISAAEVYLVGSFNGWRETDRLEEIQDGLWQITVPSDRIRDGDTYKFKIRYEGREVYLTDPFASEIDGPPNYNSVFKSIIDTSGHTSNKRRGISDSGDPVNVLAVRADRWGGGSRSYADISQELIPYMLQMGFTHICLSGLLEEYFDFDSGRTVRSYRAPKRSQGGIEGLKGLVQSMHDSGLKVMIDHGNIGSDERLLPENERYWIDGYDLDGVAETAPSVLLPSEFKPPNNASYVARYRMAEMSYVLMSFGRGLTFTNDEGRMILGETLDAYRIHNDEIARIELFASDLNNVYLSNPCLWEGNGERVIKVQGDTLSVNILHDDGGFIFVSDTSGEGCDVEIPLCDNAHVVLDSYSQRYGGEGRITPFALSKSRLWLEPYEAIVITYEKTNKDKHQNI